MTRTAHMMLRRAARRWGASMLSVVALTSGCGLGHGASEEGKSVNGQSAGPEAFSGKEHGLPENDPKAARVEMRRRMAEEWNLLLADIPTDHVESYFVVDGDEKKRRPILGVYLPPAPEEEWETRDAEVVNALLANGWVAGPDHGFVEYFKGPYAMIGGCNVSDCEWDMRSALLPPIIDYVGRDVDPPEIHRRGPSPRPTFVVRPTHP